MMFVCEVVVIAPSLLYDERIACLGFYFSDEGWCQQVTSVYEAIRLVGQAYAIRDR
jgi:hypothetical protein